MGRRQRRSTLLVCAWLFWLSACGRVGVSLVPLLPSPDGDSGPAADGGVDSGAQCSSACMNEHGAADCSRGDCTLSCELGYADCDHDPGNGCETDTQSAANSCGECARSCSNAHGSASCSEGLCQPSCEPGYADCDGSAANGCESALDSLEHCGACDHACRNPHGAIRCDAGACKPSCDGGYTDCNGDPADGCETHSASDPQHCGSCTRACKPNSEVCVDGACQASPCGPGRGECNRQDAVACETDLMSTLSDCGFCGNDCSAANATASCGGGVCELTSCAGPWGDCDGAAANGCETALGTSAVHCGDCATACNNDHGSTSCVDARCTPSCSTGYGDCDADPNDGCETALSSVDHCGDCGTSCPANGGTPICSAGVCGVQCDLTGVFALKLTLAVSWPSSTYLSSGNGTFVSWMRAALTQTGSTLQAQLTPCGQTVPDFKSTPIINETYGLTYPGTSFDRSPGQPPVAGSGTLGGLSPGASFGLGPTAWLLGCTLANPVSDAWPSRTAITAYDTDADGMPGITGSYKTNSPYSAVPTNSLGTSRAKSGYIAGRQVFSLNGTLTSCTQASGSASVTRFDIHTIGCQLTNGSDCGSSSSYLDSNAPDYQPGSSSFSLRKVASNATCSDIRSANP